MKFLKKIFESFDELSKDEILDNFLSLNDELGEPSIKTSKYGKLTKWSISWELDLNLSHLQPLQVVAGRIKNIGELIVDVQSAASRFEDYDINISLSDYLVIEITPKESGSESFEFIIKYDFRVLHLNKNEIERFFRSRGVNILNWEETYNEINETGEVEIHFSPNDGNALREFKNIFTAELNRKEDDIHREYHCDIRERYLLIYSTEEKAFVSLI
jgi:hypothetical protein